MEEAQFKCNITLTQLYNIPAPYLVLAYIDSTINSLPSDKLSYRKNPQIRGDRSMERLNVDELFKGLLDSLNFLFRRYERIMYNFNKPEPFIKDIGMSKRGLLYGLNSTSNIGSELDKTFEKLGLINIKSSDFLFRIPKQQDSRPLGMTDQQYSDYVLGYSILGESFDTILTIQYC